MFYLHAQKEQLAEAGRKQLEQLLQMNLFQQAHLLNTTNAESKSNAQLEQLQQQQQQLMSQLHLQGSLFQVSAAASFTLKIIDFIILASLALSFFRLFVVYTGYVDKQST